MMPIYDLEVYIGGQLIAVATISYLPRKTEILKLKDGAFRILEIVWDATEKGALISRAKIIMQVEEWDEQTRY